MKKISTLFLIALVNCNIIFASTASHSSSGIFDKSFLYKIINFSLLLLILHLVAKTPIKNILLNTLKNNLSKFNSAQKDKKEWDKKLAEYKKKVASLEQEIKGLKEKAEENLEEEKEASLQEAKKMADRIIEQGNKQTEMLFNNAKKQFEVQLLDKAFEIAEGKIQDKISSISQKESLKQFISTLN